MDALARVDALTAYAAETAGCVRCALSETRSRVVFGSGDPDAELMLVGEAPGFQEDQGGAPFAGQAGELLERLLAGIGFDRDDVYLANVLKCRPPQNRDPLESEIAVVRAAPLPAGRARSPSRRCDARQLRNEAPFRASLRDHARSRAGARGRARRHDRRALPALPPGGCALHALDASSARGRLLAAAGSSRTGGAVGCAVGPRTFRSRRRSLSSRTMPLPSARRPSSGSSDP